MFDRSGKYLYFFGSTDAGPAVDWFAQSNADMRFSRNVYLAVLRNDLPSPLARESDEEKAPSAAAARAPANRRKPPAERPAEPAAAPAAVRIDLDGIEFRILDMPVPAGQLASLQAGAAGHLYYLRTVDAGRSCIATTSRRAATRRSCRTSTATRSRPTAKKMLYVNNNAWSIVATTARIEPAAGRLAIDAIQVKFDPRAEWKQIFDEAWRINRDYFYAPNMHGVDWAAMKRKYELFLADVANRNDLNRVLQWMSSELSVGHHNVGGGDTPAGAGRGAGRPARRGLLGGERPLPVQEGLRRPELESAAAIAAHRAGRQRPRGRVPAGRARQGRAVAGQRLQLLREHVGKDRRDHRRSESRRLRLAHGLRSCRSRTRAPCAIATGSKAI